MKKSNRKRLKMVEIIVSVVIEVAKCLAPSMERQFSYVRNYKGNFDNLKTQVEKLEGEIVSMQHAVDEAKRKGEEIEQNVQTWLANANKALVEAKKFVCDEATANNNCFKGLCPNLKTRHRLGKEAVRQLDAIVKLREAGRFERISYSIIPEDTLLMSNKEYEAFESRMSALNNILGALKNPDVNMLGIYGMGGIGKTTLAKEVAGKAENDKLFDQVLFTEVSQSPDIRKIQGEIADKLGLKFDKESESGRARSLWSQLKKEKRILVILDNIWDYLDLRAVGIPHGDDHKGCKVLMTARSLDVLSRKMDSQQNFLIGALGEEEAWSLFKKMAGDYVEGSELKWVAKDVAKECAGLPVSIVTVARALRNKNLFEWKDALEQLRRPSSMNFKDVQPAAYKAIELSYIKLEGDELKNTFLLIGYTAITSIDELLMYGMGLGLFQGMNKMEVARARVHTLVNKLKASCMLLDHAGKNENLFSIHDVVRDVAISIASTERNVFSATNEQVDGCREWSDESAVKLYTSIFLRDIKTNVLPDQVLECPQLKLFCVRADRESSSITIPDNFFSKMIQVRVIDFTYMNQLSLPSSLGLLKNLRTLCLYNCNLLDISVIGDLRKLEILCLQESDIKKLPVEVGELTRLRLLDLRLCRKLEVIPPNVLSNLSQLEELYIGAGSFCKWEEEVDGDKNASLDELKHLLNLTSLELEITYDNPTPRGLFFEKLERYRIRIGHWIENVKINSSRALNLGLDIISLKDGLIVQLQGIEHLELHELQEQDFNYFIHELVRVGSSQLKHLCICGFDKYPSSPRRYVKREWESTNNMQSNEIILEDNVNGFNTLFIEKISLPKLETLYLYLMDIERIWQNQVAAMSCGIQNLTRLTVYKCENLRCLFPSSSVINSLVRLQHLDIHRCPILEEIIVMDQEESKKNIVRFPQLQSLKMAYLWKLTSFCIGDAHIIEFPSLKELQIITHPGQFMLKLKSTAHDLTKKRWKESTNDMGSYEIILKDNANTSKILFIEKVSLPKLETLYLHSINIERIWQNKVAAMACGIQNLTHLTIRYCRSLRWAISSSIVSCFVRLQHLEISNCPDFEEVMVKDDEKEESKNNENIVMFPQLQSLVLKNLEQLTSFSTREVHLIEFPFLKELEIMGCPSQFMVEFKHHLTKKVFPNLEELKVDAKYIVTKKCPFSEDLLCKLKYLDVVFIDESTTILSLDDFLQRLYTMKVLQIAGSYAWLPKEKVKNGMEVIIREANKCCDLKHILKQESSIMKNLNILRVKSCHHLVNLVPSSTFFQNLTTLEVSDCEGLKNVLISSTAKTLVRLREMRINSCVMITEIVVAEAAAKDEVITFSELKELKLSNMKNLTSFCSGNCAFIFPSLEILQVKDCPNMKIFSRGELSTPKLHKVELSSWFKKRWIWEHDLNTTIQQLYLQTN